MKLKQTSILLIALLLSLLLAACGGADTPTATEAPTQQLSETFNASEGGINLTFNYPQGWMAQSGEGQMLLANSKETLDIIGTGPLESLDIPDGGYGMQLVLLPTDQMPPDASPTELLSMLAEGAASEGVTVGSVEEIQVNGQAGAKASVTLPQDTGEIYLFSSGDYYVMAYAAASTYADFADSTQAVLNTVQVQ